MEPLILKLSTGSPSSYDNVRCIQEAGFRVVGTDSMPISPMSAVIEMHTVSPYSPWRTDAEHDILDLVDRLRPDYILPTIDEDVQFLSVLRNKYPGKILAPEPEYVRITQDKYVLYRYLERKGYKHLLPYALNEEDVDMKVPVVVKPRRGRGARGVTVYDSEWDFFNRPRTPGYVIQGMGEGEEYTVDVFFVNGDPIIVPRVRIEARGVSMVSQVRMDERIIEEVYKILMYFPGEAFRDAGSINVQGFFDGERFQLTEINPRFAGTANLSMKAGVDWFRYLRMKHEGRGAEYRPKPIKDGLMVRRVYRGIYGVG